MSDFKYDKNHLLEETNGGLDIIRRLYPECENGSRFVHFKLREEATASTNVFKSGDLYLVKDHGDGKAYNGIDLVMQSEQLEFSDACKWVAQEFNINGLSTAFNRPHLEIIPAEEGQEPGAYYFEYKAFSVAELAVIGPLVDSKLCTEYNLKSCVSFTQIKKYKGHEKYGNQTMQIITKSNEKYPIFVFDFDSWQKIYQPLNVDKQYRFRHSGDKPKNYIFGLDLLPDALETYQMNFEGDEEPEKLKDIIIAGGDRDALNVASLDYPVVWLNSEGAKLDYDTYKTLSDYADNVYYLGDIDKPGIDKSVNLALQYINIKIIWLPEWLKDFSYRGKPRKDFKDYVDYTFSKSNPEKLSKGFKALLYDALPARFWDEIKQENKPTKYYFNNESCLRFLKYKGFYLFEEETAKEDFSFIRVQEGVVERMKYHHISNFPAEYLRDKKKPVSLLNFIHRSGQHLSEKSLAKLDKKEIDFKDCSFDHQLMFFKNNIWKITKEGIEEIKFKNSENTYVWKDKIIQHKVKVAKNKAFNITKIGDKYDIEILNKEHDFLNYLINTSRVHWRKCGDAPFNSKLNALDPLDKDYEKAVATVKQERAAYREANKFSITEEGLTEAENQEQKEHLINKIFAYGYLLHKQKFDDRAWCVFGMDNRISDIADSNGGSGKSLLFNRAIREILLNNKYKSGRDKKVFENNHKYEGVTKNTDYMIFDDLDSHFPFSQVFSEITGDLPVNPKHGTEYLLSFSDSPKFAMTSNFGLFKADASTDRRILYCVFSDYYHHKSDDDLTEYKPSMDFGKMLFSQWNEEEYNDFFNDSAECLQFYLGENNKINPPLNNVEKRNSLQTMGDGFKDWADSYFTENHLNEFTPKKDAFIDFETKSHLKNWTAQRFKSALKEWCKYYGYIMNPEEYLNSQGRCIQNYNGATYEMVYIRTSEGSKKNNSETKQDDGDWFDNIDL